MFLEFLNDKMRVLLVYEHTNTKGIGKNIFFWGSFNLYPRFHFNLYPRFHFLKVLEPFSKYVL